MQMQPLSLIIIGSGWRAMFYVRTAKKYPELFRLKYMLCRTEEKAERIRNEQQIPVTLSEEECEKANPDFVVVAVSKSAIFDVTKKWAIKGFPVLCETPAAMELWQLKELWNLRISRGARIQVAEQYHRYPLLAAGLQYITKNAEENNAAKTEMETAHAKLSEPYAVTLSAAHDYHGISLIRRLLHMGMEPVEMSGKKYLFPVMETDSRYGAVADGTVKNRERIRITMEFASGKAAFYDFSGVQYHSFIRTRHLNVQGENWEWNDTVLRYTDENNTPAKEKLKAFVSKEYEAIITEDIAEKSREWCPVLMLDEWQDEFAVASMMLDMKKYIEEGKEIYPLAESLEDVYLWILMQKAVQNPGETVKSEKMPWHEKQI